MDIASSSHQRKDMSYYSADRSEFLGMFSHYAKNMRILDVGCGTGANYEYLRTWARYLVGVEINEAAARVASERYDRVLIGPIEEVYHDLMNERFDLIICGDVLEHLIDPWTVVGLLQNVCSPTGYMLASIPNLRYWKELINLVVLGEFYYKDWGLMDNSHLRFFTKQTMVDLFVNHGWMINMIKADIHLKGRKWPKGRVADRITLGLLTEFLATRFYFITSPRRLG